MPVRFWLLAAILAVIAMGCGGEKSEKASPTAGATGGAPAAEPEGDDDADEAEETGEAGEEAREQAQQIFATRCVTCHGAAGAGDGPGSAALTPKPRNFQDPAWQASVTDDHLAKIIQYGGAAVGKSPAMPGNPDLMSKPEIVQALVAHVRSLSAAQ
jgi:mono/diheme cytochrome c family protein